MFDQPTAKPEGWHDARDEMHISFGSYRQNPSASSFTRLTRAMIVFQQIDRNKCSPHEAGIEADEYLAQLRADGKPLFGGIEIL